MKSLLKLTIAAFEKPFILKVEDDGYSGSNCKFGGAIGQAANDLMTFGGFNCTVIRTPENEGYGHMDPLTNKYNGMNGVVQRSEVDLALAVQMIPMETDDFLYGPVISYSRITILSSYEPHNSSLDETLDVTEAFTVVDSTVWWFFLFFLILFSILLSIGKRIYKSTDGVNSFWTVMSYTFAQPSFGAVTNAYFQIYCIILSIFIFFCHQYFSNYMTTELVRPKIPRTIDSFEDVLNFRFDGKNSYVDSRKIESKKELAKLNYISPYFLKAIRSIKYFENAPIGSVKRKIMDRAIKLNGDREKSQLDFQDAFKNEFFSGLFRGTSVIVDAETVLRLIRVTLCDILIRNSPKGDLKRYLLFARNASIPYLLGYVYSEKITPQVRLRLDDMLYKFGESGLANKLVLALSHAIMESTPQIERCLVDEVHYEINDIMSLDVKHVSVVFVSMGSLFAVSLIALILEAMVDHSKIKRPKLKFKRTRPSRGIEVRPLFA